LAPPHPYPTLLHNALMNHPCPNPHKAIQFHLGKDKLGGAIRSEVKGSGSFSPEDSSDSMTVEHLVVYWPRCQPESSSTSTGACT
jgi:hypothetical protein